MTTWTVFKKGVIDTEVTRQRGWPKDPNDDNAYGWVEVGTYDTENHYWLDTGTASALGQKHGAGEYLLLADDRFKRITVVERTVYEEEVPPEPVGDSVEDVMSREG